MSGGGFHIRVWEPGLPVAIYIKASWGSEAEKHIQGLMVEAFTAAMQRIKDGK